MNNATTAFARSLAEPFAEAFSIAAIEAIQKRARPMTGLDVTGNLLEMQITVSDRAPDKVFWSLWLDDCPEGPYKPELTWRHIGPGNRGAVHRLITKRIHAAAAQMLPQLRIGTIQRTYHMELVYDISALTGHQKAALAALRARALAAPGAQTP